jgi:aminoglycoside phosphotransferase
VFLNPGVEACVANARLRPWEPHKYASKAAQDANLEMLIAWIRDYAMLPAHRATFDAFAGEKIELTSREAIAAFACVAAETRISVAWINEVGGVTFKIGDQRFVKWSRDDLDRERIRLQWAIRYATVPEVLDHGRDADGAWLVTRALPGTNAVDDRWKAAPAVAVAAIGAGLRRLHDALPVAECPFTWSIEERVADIRRRAALGTIRRARPSDDNDIERAIAMLERPPSIDRLVVCHGDSCAPNTLVAEDGRCCGHVDLGALGVADRWADLAIATWSTEWNYGPGWEDALLEAYGVARDDVRIRYYRLLWDLS